MRVRGFLMKMTMNRILAILLLLAVALPARAGVKNDFGTPLKPAQQALAADDYAKAYALYVREARHNPLAQFMLGMFEREGWGRAADPTMACGWFEKAARKSIPVAQEYYGDCLAQGIGRAADGKAALGWYEKAADGGDLIAKCAAAELYIRGDGVGKNVQKGMALCAEAAQAGSPSAMLKLADYYREGTDVPQDMAAARNWYQQAAERRVPEAQYQLGAMLAAGQGGEPDLATALVWLETAAGAGYAPAYLPVAILYANAQVDPATGALRPEHLAKIYLWNSAAKARATDPAQLAEIARIDESVDKIMPPAWKPDLDKKVAEYLANYPAHRD